MESKFKVGQVVKYEDRYVRVTHVFPIRSGFMYATTEEADVEDNEEPWITVGEKSLKALTPKEKGTTALTQEEKGYTDGIGSITAWVAKFGLTRWSAKPIFAGSNPASCSNNSNKG